MISEYATNKHTCRVLNSTKWKWFQLMFRNPSLAHQGPTYWTKWPPHRKAYHLWILTQIAYMHDLKLFGQFLFQIVCIRTDTDQRYVPVGLRCWEQIYSDNNLANVMLWFIDSLVAIADIWKWMLIIKLPLLMAPWTYLVDKECRIAIENCGSCLY